ERLLQRLQFRRGPTRRRRGGPILSKAAGHATGSILGHFARQMAALFHALIELVNRLLERRDMLELLLRRSEAIVDPGKFALDGSQGLRRMVLAHRLRNPVVEVEDPLLKLGDLIADLIATALLQPFGNLGQAPVEIGERAQIRPLCYARRKLLD